MQAAVLVAGKRHCLRTPAPPPSGPTPLAQLLRVVDGPRQFLVDTGAQVSVLPPTQLPAGACVDSSVVPRLTAANGSTIVTVGYTEHVVTLMGRCYPWRFLVAEVAMPILGADFLAEHGLTVDMGKLALCDPAGDVCADGVAAPAASLGLRTLTVEPTLDRLWQEFSAVTCPPAEPAAVRHNVTHHIETHGPPRFARPRRLAPDRLSVARQEFDRLLADGVVRPSKSSWAAPLHMVPKPVPGEWRVCGDYRALNAVTVPDRYPIPYLQDFTAHLQGCRYFSKLDLARAFYQIPVEAGDVHKTAVTTPFGLFEATRMPFGLRNAAQTCQRFLDEVLRGLPACFAYIDDVLIASATLEEHAAHLRQVLQRLQDYGVVVNVPKCVLGAARLRFLGYEVSAAGIAPLPDRVAAITAFPRPTTEQQLRRFVGMTAFYHRFIPNAAELLRPLHQLVGKQPGRKRAQQLSWTDAAEDAFPRVKSALASAALLAHPVSDAPLSIAVDASSTGVGAVLQQHHEGAWQPLAFFSRSLTPTETRYSTFGRELLALYLSVRHFRHAIEGRALVVYTDHKPLVRAIGSPSDRHSPRETRHLDYVAQFCTDVRHVPGRDNVAPDTLSRTVAMLLAPQPPLDDFEALAGAQREDAELLAFCNTDHGLELRDAVLGNGQTLIVDESTGVTRPLVPAPLRRQVFRLLHDLSHPGVRATLDLVSRRFVWPGMRRDVRLWARSCLPCQRSKVQRHTKTPVMAFPAADERFRHIHVDLVGPLPPSEGYRYLLTAVDRFSRWPEAVPLRGITAAEVARALISGWISRFGVPAEITTDRGSQFESALWTELSALLGCSRRRTTAYHPQGNGMVERLHRQLKAALRAAAPTRWTEALPLVLLGIRSAMKFDIGCSAAELVYGAPLRLPGELVAPSETTEPPTPASFSAALQRTMQALRPTAPRRAPGRFYVPRALADATHVLVRHDAVKPPLAAPYDGPYRIVARSDKTVTIDRRGRHDVVSLDRVKPAHVDDRLPAQHVSPTPRPPASSPAQWPVDAPDEDDDGQLLFVPPDLGRPADAARSPPEPSPAVRRPHSGGTAPPAPARPAAAPPVRPRPDLPTPPPVRRTRSGREVHVPARYRSDPPGAPPPRPAGGAVTLAPREASRPEDPSLLQVGVPAAPVTADRCRRCGGFRACHVLSSSAPTDVNPVSPPLSATVHRRRRVSFHLPQAREGAL